MGVDDRDQDAGLSGLRVDRVRDIGQEEDGHVQQAERGVVGTSALGVQREVPGEQLPVRPRQQAGGHLAVVDVVGLRAGFDHHATREQEWVRRVVTGAPSGAVNTDRATDVIEAAGLGIQVVGAAGGLDVLVVVSAGEKEVAVRSELRCSGVVAYAVCADGVSAIRYDDLAVERIDVAVALLRVGTQA